MADSLVKKGAKRWFEKHQNPLLFTGIPALVTSFAMANPIPIVAWAVTTGIVGFLRITDEKYIKSIADEHQQQLDSQQARRTEERTQAVWQRFGEGDVQQMVSNGDLPNYRRVYDRLVHIRDKVKERAHARDEISVLSEVGMEERMNRMLDTFLSFVRFRLDVVSFLTELAANESARGKSLRLTGTIADRMKRLMDNIDQRIEDMRAAPSSTARVSHISLLVKKQENIRKVALRDTQVAEQLDAFLDIYDSIFAQYNQEQFEQGEVDEYVERTIGEMERVEKSAKEMQPFMNDLSELA